MSSDKIPKDHAEELGDCFAAHARGLFGYACALTRGDRALADDLVQSTFVAAARQWSTMRCLRDAQRLRWLQTTVSHLAISSFRHNGSLGDHLPRRHACPVAGIALLLVLGRQSALGGALLAAGLRVVGSPLGIIAAMLFVSAPLFVSAAREAFSRVDVRYESVARTLGDAPWTVFRRVTLPLAMRGLVAAGVVMWTRAVSEFGAIVILTYNPKVASVLSYDRFTSFGLSEALPVAAILALLALVPLVALRALRPERGPVDA